MLRADDSNMRLYSFLLLDIRRSIIKYHEADHRTPRRTWVYCGATQEQRRRCCHHAVICTWISKWLWWDWRIVPRHQHGWSREHCYVRCNCAFVACLRELADFRDLPQPTVIYVRYRRWVKSLLPALVVHMCGWRFFGAFLSKKMEISALVSQLMYTKTDISFKNDAENDAIAWATSSN